MNVFLSFRQLDFAQLSWFFAFAITIHNVEEAVLLPAWSHSVGPWHPSVDKREFSFAVGVLTILAYFLAYLAASSGKDSVSAYLLSGYALAMLINVLFPHTLATIALRRYAPGTATALLFNLPITVLLLFTVIQTGSIQLARFLWMGPLVVIGLLGALPLLFALGRVGKSLKSKGREEEKWRGTPG